eukprot:3321102-Alexandrium_andersonii.AAC.1
MRVASEQGFCPIRREREKERVTKHTSDLFPCLPVWVRACMHACERACARGFVRACVRARACMRAWVGAARRGAARRGAVRC